MASFSSSILLMFFLILVEVKCFSDGAVVWPIWYMKDPKLVIVAKFAIAQHNKKANTTLQFVTMVDANYEAMTDGKCCDVYLLFLAKNNKIARPKKYEASVLYTPQQKTNSMELKKFNKHKEPAVGGLWWIKNLRDPKVVSVAEFAVAEYNKKANTTLRCESVIKGKVHLVSGFLYHLLILGKDSNSPYQKRYETAVYDGPCGIKGGLELDSFKLFEPIWIPK